MKDALWLILAATHLLAAAGWFGAMLYSLLVLHPGARRFFGNDDEQFEAFIATISQGARWKVLGAFFVIGGSGVALIPFAAARPEINVLIILKTALLAIAMGIFCYASWRLWPARIFASPAEAIAIRRKFKVVAMSLIAIAAIEMILGVWIHRV